MRPQKRRNVQVVHRLLPRSANRQQLKHLPPHSACLGPPVLTQEALRLSQSLGQLLRSSQLNGVRDISEEEQNFEFRVGRAEVLEFVWSGVSGSDEGLGNYPFADWKTRSKRLVGDVGYRRRGIVDADPRGETAKGLESPDGGVSREDQDDESTYSKNCSCVTPSWFSCDLGFPENKAENLRSKLIKS